MAVIGPAAFLTSLGIGIIGLGLLLVVMDVYGASPAQIGWFGAVWSTCYFIGCMALAKLVAMLRARTAMAFMLTASVAIFGLFLIFPGMWQAFAAYGLYGFLTAFFWPPMMGWLSKSLEGKALSKATSWFSFSWSFGGVLSPYVAGLLSERGKFLPIWVAMAVFGLNAVFVLTSRLWLSDPDEAVSSAAAQPTDGQEDRSTPLRYPAWLGVVLIYMVMGVILNVFPVFARGELGLSESRVGFLLTVRAVATAFGFVVLSRWHGWQFKRLAIPGLSLLAAASLAFLAFQMEPLGFGLGFTVAGLVMAMVYNNSLFYATSGALDRDKRANTHEALLTAGQVLGSVAGGLMYQDLSMPLVFAGLAGLLGIGAAMQLGMLRR